MQRTETFIGSQEFLKLATKKNRKRVNPKGNLQFHRDNKFNHPITYLVGKIASSKTLYIQRALTRTKTYKNRDSTEDHSFF